MATPAHPAEAGGSTRPVIGGIIPEHLLSAGGREEVWSGHDAVSGESVTVRVCRGAPAMDEERRRVAAFLCSVEHPSLLRLHRVTQAEDGRRVVVVRRVDGLSLEELLLERGELTPPELVTLLAPLAEALVWVHAHGAAHGGISPTSVILAAAGHPVLGDLGACLVNDASPLAYAPGFADPAASRGADPRAGDVWSLAAVGWYALAGKAPVPGRLERPMVLLTYPALAGLLVQCLDQDATVRPEPAELARRLRAASRSAPVRVARGCRGDVPAFLFIRSGR